MAERNGRGLFLASIKSTPIVLSLSALFGVWAGHMHLVCVWQMLSGPRVGFRQAAGTLTQVFVSWFQAGRGRAAGALTLVFIFNSTMCNYMQCIVTKLHCTQFS